MKTAIYQITYNCNQNCKFCLNNNNKQELPLEKKKQIIDILYKQNVKNLIITGGEPFTSKDLLPLIEYCQNKFNIIIQTNGTIINHNIINKIQGLEISLQGLKNEHNYLTNSNNFDKVIKNIKQLSPKINIVTNFVITKKNINCLENYIKLVKNLGVKASLFTKPYISGNLKLNKELIPNKIEFDNFLNILKKQKFPTLIQPGFNENYLKQKGFKNYNTCTIDKEITINPQGLIKPCPAFPTNFGTIFTTPMSILNNIKPCNGCLVNKLQEIKNV